MLYETAIAVEVFGVDRSDLSAPGDWYELIVCTQDGSPAGWFPEARTRDFTALAEVDMVVVPSSSALDGRLNPALSAALCDAHAAGVRIAALCTGAFVVAAAGLLDGRAATTHWMHAEQLAADYPLIDVRPDVLYLDDGGVFTSAGKTAALDLCLHLVYRDYGAAVANGLARRLVVPSHRPGGQAQFIASPADPRVTGRLGPALDWARARLDQPFTIRELAREAGLSARQLARRMHTEIGVGPLAWLHQQRVTRAQDLLERTDASIEQIAVACGMGTATTLRRHFARAVGVSPMAYRTAFRG